MRVTTRKGPPMPKINALVAELQKHIWAMEPKHLEALLLQVAELDVGGYLTAQAEAAQTLAAKAVEPLRVNNGVAVIPISGYLMKGEVPAWLAWFGIAATSQETIRAKIAEAVGNKAVDTIVLHIYSPGGQVAGGEETATAIAAAGKVKPVTAYIEDLGASMAYWLASGAGRIIANPNAEVGSIGIYTVYVDSAKEAEEMGLKVHVIRSGEYKGMGVAGAAITDKQIAGMQEVVDGLGANFIAAVAAGRGMKKTQVKPLATGQVWLAAGAKDVGLIDEVAILDPVGGAMNFLAKQSKGNAMSDNDKVDAEQIRQEAAAQAVKGDQARLKELQAAFPNEPAFVLEQFAAGADVTAAKAAYADVLQGKLEAVEAEKAQLQAVVDAGKADAAGKKKPAVIGAEPVTNSDEGGDSGDSGGDFMAVSRERAKTDKISMTDAMKAVAKENPDLHDRYVEGCPTVRVDRKTRRVNRN